MIDCDFCSHPDAHWSYPARDFVHERDLLGIAVDTDGHVLTAEIDLAAGSRGGWSACNVCHALIERGDRVLLARRAAKRIIKKQNLPTPLSNMIALIRPFHDQFWANREGAPTPL